MKTFRTRVALLVLFIAVGLIEKHTNLALIFLFSSLVLFFRTTFYYSAKDVLTQTI